jgi:hypothetical protein
LSKRFVTFGLFFQLLIFNSPDEETEIKLLNSAAQGVQGEVSAILKMTPPWHSGTSSSTQPDIIFFWNFFFGPKF